MKDDDINELIETLNCMYEDYADAGVDTISVAGVMLAVAVKTLQRTLDKEEFDAILSDLSDNQFGEWADLPDDDASLVEYEQTKKRIIH